MIENKVEILEQLRDYCTDDPILRGKHAQALTHAIKCVELMPELVEALVTAKARLEVDWTGHVIDDIDNMINKAKELVE